MIDYKPAEFYYDIPQYRTDNDRNAEMWYQQQQELQQQEEMKDGTTRH